MIVSMGAAEFLAAYPAEFDGQNIILCTGCLFKIKDLVSCDILPQRNNYLHFYFLFLEKNIKLAVSLVTALINDVI